MAEAIREVALEKIVSKLQAMTGTRPWGGSYPNDPTVTRVWKDLAQVTQFPTLIVVEGPGSRIDIEATVGATVQVRHTFKAVLYGYVHGDDQVSRSQWMQRLWDDCLRTLYAAATLDGTIRDLTFDESLEVDEGAFEPVGAFAQGLTILADEAIASE